MSLADIRKEYRLASFDEAHADADPFVQFRHWFDDAVRAELPEPTACALATCTPDAYPSVRMVLCKGIDARGFVFYTDYRSRKGRELADNPHAALCFHWVELERQVRIGGAVARVSRAESAEYFATRPRGSRIGAWVSHQSSVIPDRATLDDARAMREAEFGDEGDVPLPEHWGGFRIIPEEIEFWQGRESRLHDRVAYVREAGRWVRRRLSP